ncbi:MAG: C40 family peptidase [Clostridia bacterium]|nr:C40 family peptidase [Clostridia bacterium]
MKKALNILFSVVLAASLIPVSVNADNINGVGATSASSLNIRSAPSTNAEITGRLAYGNKINIITKTGEWYKIDMGGKIGYVHVNYVSASRSGEPVLYNPEADMSIQTAEGSSKGQQVVNIAKSYMGVPYVWAGTSPSGFDCSGLVQYVYKQMGVSLNRVAADQTAHGTPVSKENLKPGDIVFFHNTSRYTRINHVGIYVGDGMFIHAPQTGDVVKLSPINTGYYNTTFVTARRIFD